jgi:hypothetical protein
VDWLHRRQTGVSNSFSSRSHGFMIAPGLGVAPYHLSQALLDVTNDAIPT